MGYIGGYSTHLLTFQLTSNGTSWSLETLMISGPLPPNLLSSAAGGWGMDLKFYCPEPWAAEKEGKAEAGPDFSSK